MSDNLSLEKHILVVDIDRRSECAELHRACSKHADWPRDFYEPGEERVPDQAKRLEHELTQMLFNEAISLASTHFGRTMVPLYRPTLRKYPTGSSLSEHHDEEENYVVGARPQTFLTEGAMYIYLNDDYDGGELFFGQLGLRIKPKAGQMIAWPSGLQFSHGVAEVKNGDRYAISSFLTTPKLLALDLMLRSNHEKN